jgi:hypothetical protein
MGISHLAHFQDHLGSFLIVLLKLAKRVRYSVRLDPLSTCGGLRRAVGEQHSFVGKLPQPLGL